MGKKIVFCGGGNMAEGVLRSLLNREVAKAEDITVSEIFEPRCAYLKETYGVVAAPDVTEAMKDADMFIVAVLPKHVPIVTKTIKEMKKADAIVLSIAAGVTIAKLEEQVGEDAKVVRVMPNTLNQSGNGHSAACVNGNIDEEDKVWVTAVLDSLGQTMYIEESMFGAFTAFSCSGPMWIYELADALIDAGVYVGFSRRDAKNIVLKNILGAGMVLDMTGEAPKEKLDEMCSPGGVTIEGFKALHDDGFPSAVMTSVKKAVDKANGIK